ncbi:MAG: Hsp20/alpha crystallin family protein [bacterium]|nr:Hsp20/alpha crystallin family protein [bacterium]
MYLTVSRPRNRFGLMNGEIDRMFNEIFNGGSVVESEVGWVPRADVHETDETFLIQLDVPGIDKNDIKVKFEDNTLIVSGERKYENKEEDKNYRHVERIYGTFTRTLKLPKDVDAQKIAANYKNGVLEITLPKAEEVKPKEIEIKIG